MRIAVTGYKGRLGSELVKWSNILPLDCDVTNAKSIKDAVDDVQPDLVIHCAGMTNVDASEENMCEEAKRVNILGTYLLGQVFPSRIIYISTDYVFDGAKGNYSEAATPNPIGHYGYTKYMGEQAIINRHGVGDIIVRTTVLYGGNKPDFVTKILDQLKEKMIFEVTTKVIGTPTYVPHLSEALLALCQLPNPPRIVNIAGDDLLSRYDFALMIANVWGYDPKLIMPTNSMPGSAHRPSKAGLKTALAKKLGLPIYSVLDGLKSMKFRMEIKK